MGRTTGRSPDQTRRLILQATAQLVRTQGMNATLDDIAELAGVSKGGVIYHFTSKDELITALAIGLFDSFRLAVDTHLDPDDTTPGRLTRAYIRACLDSGQDETTARQDTILTAQLTTSPEIAALAKADAERWHADLYADGLPRDIVALIIAAADGATSATVWGGVTQQCDYERIERQLTVLTREPEAWQRLGTVTDTSTLTAQR